MSQMGIGTLIAKVAYPNRLSRSMSGLSAHVRPATNCPQLSAVGVVPRSCAAMRDLRSAIRDPTTDVRRMSAG
jgi:hypothetical protein